MATGRVLRFDEARGYGFIAPDSGGEDVFLHVNDLSVDKDLIRPGVAVEFEVEGGDRGLKASSVRLVGRAAAAPKRLTATTRAVGREGGELEEDEGLCDVLSEAELRLEVTEFLLRDVESLTGAQIRAVREGVLRLATRHGWVES